MGKDKPCCNCDRRYPTCHSNCEDYKKFRKDLDEKNALMRKRKEQSSMYPTWKKHR